MIDKRQANKDRRDAAETRTDRERRKAAVKKAAQQDLRTNDERRMDRERRSSGDRRTDET